MVILAATGNLFLFLPKTSFPLLPAGTSSTSGDLTAAVKQMLAGTRSSSGDLATAAKQMLAGTRSTRGGLTAPIKRALALAPLLYKMLLGTKPTNRIKKTAYKF